MEWKCKICKDRGAIMLFSGPSVCECQKTASTYTLEDKSLGVNFAGDTINIDFKKNVIANMGAYIELFVTPHINENSSYYIREESRDDAYRVTFTKCTTP